MLRVNQAVKEKDASRTEWELCCYTQLQSTNYGDMSDRVGFKHKTVGKVKAWDRALSVQCTVGLMCTQITEDVFAKRHFRS